MARALGGTIHVHDVPYALRRESELAANPDLHFVEAVLAELSTRQDGAGSALYDTSDAYAAGMSNGAQFTMFVAQCLPDVIRAAAIQLGGYGPPLGSMRGPNWKGDIPSNPPPMIVVNTLGLDYVLPIVGLFYKELQVALGGVSTRGTRGTHTRDRRPWACCPDAPDAWARFAGVYDFLQDVNTPPL